MAAFPVFTSYAQSDRDRHLDKFVQQFRDQLRALTGDADATAMVFFDRDQVEAGDQWTEVITDAVNGADVLLCLMSPTYFSRPWCGRELEAFLRRQSRLPRPAAKVRFIFPIWWQVPPAPRPLPRKLSVYHNRDAQFPPDYESAGVKGLARRSRWTQFQQVVDRLAHLVAETLAQPHRLPLGEAVADILEIANAFDEEQPYDVRMLALTTGGDAWRPSATDAAVGEACAETARRLKIFIRKVETGSELRQRLEKAEAAQQIILVLADAALPADAVLHMINGLPLENLALLLVDVGTPAVGDDAWLKLLPDGSFLRAKTRGVVRIAGAGELGAQMERLVDEARRRLQATALAAPVEDASLRKAAEAQGLSIDVQPSLTGPGAERQP
jgi:hypothetical protein